MGAWIGLVGVVAGALLTLASQHLIRNSEIRERRDTFLLEQLAIIVALSYDYQNRIWEERHGIAAGVVAAWDFGTYRLAEAKIRILCQDRKVLSALTSLNQTGGELGRSWRTSPENVARTKAAIDAHSTAIEQFEAVSSKMLPRQRVQFPN